jgi:hypothetical protein
MTRVQTRTTERKAMRRMPWGLVLCVLILGAALAGCDGPNRGSGTQPSSASSSGLFLQLVASPNTVRGQTAGSEEDAGGCAAVQAKVSNTSGQLVSGVEVTFTTTLCCFSNADPGEAATSITAFGLTRTTLRGVATVVFCAKRERGTATITAVADDAFATTLITVF